MSLRTVLRRALPAGALLAVGLCATGLVARAAGSATINDDATFFTSVGRADIQRAAARTNLRFMVITNSQSFPTIRAWRAYLRSQATDPNAVTIGLHAYQHRQRDVYAIAGPNTGVTGTQVQQALDNARPTFFGGDHNAATSGMVRVIQQLGGAGAVASGGNGAPSAPAPSPSPGLGLGVLVPIIIILGLAFFLVRRLMRRRVPPAYGEGPGYGAGYGAGPGAGAGPYNNQYGAGPYQGGYPNQGNQGGGAGRSFLGGLAGGVAGGIGGAFIGNELFGNRGGGNVNAADPNLNNDPSMAAPADTPDAQQLQGGQDAGAGGGGGNWDNAGGGWDNSGADSGGWGGDSGGGGGDTGNW